MTARAREICAPLAGEPPAPAAADARAVGSLSFERVYRREFAFVWRTLRYLGVPEAAVEDVAQEVFIVVHERREVYDPRAGSLRAWIFGIARRSALRYHRTARRKGARRHAAEAAANSGLGLLREREDPGADPEQRLARRQAAAIVERFLESLSPARREVFTLHELEGLSAPAIAELLGVKLNTVYSRLRRARAQFRDAVARERARERRRCHAR